MMSVFTRPLARPIAALTIGVSLFAGLPAVSASAATVAERPGISAGVTVPGATTTGVPVGTRLTVRQGDLTITTPGTVVDGLDIRGVVFVQAANVTIRNSVVRGRAVTVNTGLINAQAASVKNLVIDNVELAPTTPSVRLTGIYGSNFTLTDSNIHHVVDGVHIFGDTVNVSHNWIHDLSHFEVDPAQNGGPTHDDDIQVQKGTNIQIKDNVLSGSANAALQVTQDQGAVKNLLVENNVVSGGGCSLNIAQKGRVTTAITGVMIRDNSFGTSKYNCNAIIDTATLTITTIANNSRLDGKAVTIMKR
jgi:hypothetical protein